MQAIFGGALEFIRRGMKSPTMVARSGHRDHISRMIERSRSFSQTRVRDASRPAPAAPVARPTREPVEVEARLDPRASAENLPKELGGPKGPEPTRFGDWEHNGRCTDF